MTLLSPNHNYAADECIAHMHIPSSVEKIRASERFDKTVLVAAHQAALHDAYILEMGTHPLNVSPVTPVSPTSSIGGLKVVSLKQLKIGKVHRNRVLHGTLCTKSLCTKGLIGLAVVNVLEDEEGKATPIFLNNALKENYSSAQAQRIYPQGSRVAVREPYLRRFPDGEIGLMVEKHADLVFLWVPEVTESLPEILTSDGDERALKEGLVALDNGDVYGNGHASAGDEMKAVKKTEDLCTDGVVANGNDDESSSGQGEEPTEKLVGENVGRELSFEDIIAFRGEGKREIAQEGGDEEVEQWRDEGGEVGKVAVGGGENVGEKAQRELQPAEVAEKGAQKVEVLGNVETAAEMDGVPLAEAGIAEAALEELEVLENIEPAAEAVVADAAAKKGAVEVAEVSKNGAPAAETDGGSATEAAIPEVVVEVETEEEEAVAEIPKVVVEEETEEEEAVAEVKMAASGGGETCARLRIRGNEYFARAEYKLAAEMYSMAVEKARREEKEEEQLALSNRAESWLRLGRSKAALEDAEAALRILGGRRGLAAAKALFRKGRALMGLRLYEEAMGVLEQVLEAAPSDRQLREAAITCRERLKRLTKPGKRQRAAAAKRQQRQLPP